MTISHEEKNGDSKFTFGINEDELKKAIGATSGGTAGTEFATKKYVEEEINGVHSKIDDLRNKTITNITQDIQANKDKVDQLTEDIQNGKEVFFNAKADADTVQKVQNKKTIEFAGDGNVKTSITQDATSGKTTVKFALNQTDLKIGKKNTNGKDGEDGKFTVSGKDGSSVTIEGKDGKITVAGKDNAGKDNSATLEGKDGSIGLTKDGTNTKITLEKNGKPDVNGEDNAKMPRLTYTTQNGKDIKTLATLDDGIKLEGNEGDNGKPTKGHVKLNQTLSIVGNPTHFNDWSDTDQGENIMTKVQGSQTTIALAKSLTKLESAVFENPTKSTNYTRIDTEGLHLNNGGKSNIDINHNGIKLSGKKISGLADGEKADEAVNKGQLDKQIETVKHIIGLLRQKTEETDITIGKNGPGGKDGKITVVGKGNSVEIEGKDGSITAKDENGKNSVAINGKDGSIGLTKDGTNTKITLEKNGKPDVNGEDNAKMPRLTYTTQNGKDTKTHEIATLDDGLKFVGNAGNTNVKLNQKFEIKGGDSHKDNEWDTEFDKGQNIMTKVENSKTTIALAKKLTGLQSATFGDPITNTRYTKIDSEGLRLGNNGININHDRGIDLADKKIYNVADAEDEKDAVNKGQVERMIADRIANGSGNANANIKFKGDNGDDTSAKNGTITLAGGQTDKSKLSDKPNIGVVSEDGKLNFKLAKDIDVNSVKANKITAGGVTIENGKISGITSAIDPKGELADKLKAIDNDASKTAAVKATEKKAAIKDALDKAEKNNVATVGDLKNVTNGLDSVVENVTNITNNITNITNMVANSDDKKKIDEASKAIDEYKKDQNDKNKQKAEEAINANKIKTYNPYGTTVKNNTTIVDAIKNINERGVKFMHISDSDKVGENDDLSVNNNDSQANKKGSIGIGMNAISDGTDAIATGTGSKASGANAIAMGKGAQAVGENTISIGTGNKVTGKNSGAIGDPTKLENVNGVYSMGNNNVIQGSNDSTNTAKDIFAIGNNIGSDTKKVTDKANGSVILGSKGYSNVKNGVALGYGSNADRGALTDKTSAYNGNDTGVQNTIKGTYGAVSVGDKDNTRQITNVAAGSADSDAVNVAQLKAATSKIIASTGGISMSNVTIDPKTGKKVTITDANRANYAPKVTNDGVNSVAIGANSVANRPNTVSVGSAGNERIISNVADGVAPTDAANMRQLQSVANMVGEVKKDAMAGTASAMAIGNLPQATIPGKGMMAVGVGFYKGEQATALGVSKMSENGKWVFKASASYDSQRNVGAAGAIGFHF